METLRGNEDVEAIQRAFVAPQVALQGVLEPVKLAPRLGQAFLHGQSVGLSAAGAEQGAAEEGHECAVYSAQSLLGVGRIEAGLLRPVRVFATPDPVVLRPVV